MTSTTDGGVETTLAELPGFADTDLGFSAWREMTQDEVNRFADVTRDHNFIHVDPERAAQTPFGGTIAHGFFTLALIAPATQLLRVTDAATSINYGLDKVRFPAPLPVGSRYRTRIELGEVSEIKGGVQVHARATVEVENSDRPACVAECLLRFYA
jgi:acyl dehydratase